MLANQDQATLWNGSAGEAWVGQQPLLDTMFAGFEERLVAETRGVGARRVLDIGCGAGATTLAIARQLGAGGACTGVDVSAPLTSLARARATRVAAAVEFVTADAQTHPFDAGGFDLAVSRFGVMFFDDPVAAFANIRRALRARGCLRAVAFRSPAENPFMTTAERAAAPLLPELPPRRPEAPGQFAFADSGRVRRILAAAGWSTIELDAIDVDCAFPAQALDDYFTRLGPVGQAIGRVDAATRARVVERVREAFAPFVSGDVVRFVAACWMIGATA